MDVYIPEKILVKWSESCLKNVNSIKRKTQKHCDLIEAITNLTRQRTS